MQFLNLSHDRPLMMQNAGVIFGRRIFLPRQFGGSKLILYKEIFTARASSCIRFRLNDEERSRNTDVTSYAYEYKELYAFEVEMVQ